MAGLMEWSSSISSVAGFRDRQVENLEQEEARNWLYQKCRKLVVAAQPIYEYCHKNEMANSLKYLLNCFLLVVPVLLWNILLVKQLPAHMQTDVFWRDIPAFVAYGENVSRTIVMILPLFMPLVVETDIQKAGLLVYGIGSALYFLSWIVLILVPASHWSTSLPGSLAPAVSPLIWLIGIGMVGRTLYFRISYKPWMYFVASTIFIVFHGLHTWIIYERTSVSLKHF